MVKRPFNNFYLRFWLKAFFIYSVKVIQGWPNEDQNQVQKLVTGQNFDSTNKQNKKYNITEALVRLKSLRYQGYP